MEKFSEIVKKYNIKCYDKLFEKLVINKFKNIGEINSETLLIGIPYKIKIIDKLNILILGYELDNKKILDYFLSNKQCRTHDCIDDLHHESNQKLILFCFYLSNHLFKFLQL